MSENRKKALIISKEPVTRNPKGAGIRYFNFARYLSSCFEVCVLAPEDNKLIGKEIRIVKMSYRNIREEMKSADICIYNGSWFFWLYPLLSGFKGKLILDLISSPFEDILDIPKWLVPRQMLKYRELYHLSDECLVLSAARKIFLEREFELKNISVVPNGIGSEFVHGKRLLKGVHPKIGEEEMVILSYGRILKWYDPKTLIDAFKKVAIKYPKAKLVFLGARRKDVKLTDQEKEKIVFIDWVDYSVVGDYLLEADVGVITHLATEEAKYSFRIRALDLIRANVPMIVSEGGAIAEILKKEGGGIVVPPENPEALAQALIKMLGDRKFCENAKLSLRKIAEGLEWAKVLSPLKRICGEEIRCLPKRPGFLKVLCYYLLAAPLEIVYYLIRAIGKMWGGR